MVCDGGGDQFPLTHRAVTQYFITLRYPKTDFTICVSMLTSIVSPLGTIAIRNSRRCLFLFFGGFFQESLEPQTKSLEIRGVPQPMYAQPRHMIVDLMSTKDGQNSVISQFPLEPVAVSHQPRCLKHFSVDYTSVHDTMSSYIYMCISASSYVGIFNFLFYCCFTHFQVTVVDNKYKVVGMKCEVSCDPHMSLFDRT